jgi:membrane-associated phospholipid phosphatase
MTLPIPFILLVLVAAIAGALATLAARRLVPPEGATAAAAEAIEEQTRPWLRARLAPAEATGLALTVALAAIVVGGLIVAVLALLVRGHDALRSIDSAAAEFGNHHATHLSTHLLTWVTDFGDWPVFPLIGVVVVLLETRRRPSLYLVPFLVTVWAGNWAATTAIKDLVDRARPTLNPLAATLGPSFPSGHSSTSASFYAALALVLSRGRGARTRALLVGAAVAIAVAVASSRVLLDDHWLTDVVAGLALGWAWFAVCAIAFGGRLLRFGAPVEPIVADDGRQVPSPTWHG